MSCSNIARIILIFLSFLCVIRSNQLILVINIVDEDISAASMAVDNVWTAIKSTRIAAQIYVFMYEPILAQLSGRLTSSEGVNQIPIFLPYSAGAMKSKDQSIDKKVLLIDHSSAILDSLQCLSNFAAEKNELTDNDTIRVVSISFSSAVSITLTDRFKDIFYLFDNKDTTSANRVLLLAKTQRLTSISDWYDLQIIGLVISSYAARQWLKLVKNIYKEYSSISRQYFSMIEPRPAILEAAAQLGEHLNIQYLRQRNICAEHHNNRISTSRGDSLQEVCKDARDAFVKIDCGVDISYNPQCAVIGIPHQWKSKLDVSSASMSLSTRLKVPENEWNSRLPNAEFATRRFLDAEGDEPSKFCWDHDNDSTEAGVTSSLYSLHEGKLSTQPYAAPLNKTAETTRFIVYTASSGAWGELDRDMYPSLGRQYYARRHGYEFRHVLSPEFMPYFDNNMQSLEEYCRSVSLKAIMVLDGIYRTNADWLFWMDADTQINSEWIDLNLSVYTKDIPSNKVWVSANYKGLLTGVFLVRNNIQGRRLLRDWLAVTMSGHISCHGFDQAAIEVLMLQRLNGSFDSLNPFGLSCKHDRFGGTGCDAKGDFSCDYKFERTLSQIGFSTQAKGFYGTMSSFSRGCANRFVIDFEVSYETPERPRLHCFYCGLNNEIASKYWDGPLGGSNDLVRDGAVNAWFTNHKMQWLFIDTWLEKSACTQLVFLSPCPNHALSVGLERRPVSAIHRLRLVGLVDGIALDLQQNVYCELSDEAKNKQKSYTYMRDYPKAISVAKSYSRKQWNASYYRSVTVGSHPEICENDSSSFCANGIRWPDKRSAKFLLPKDYCERCQVVGANVGNGSDMNGRLRKALQCMLDD